MKNNLKKKLSLNKTTVSNLHDEELKNVRGASLLVASCICEETESCSLVYCCPPTLKLNNPEKEQV